MLLANMGTREVLRRAVERLMRVHGLTKAQLATRLGKSRPWATNFMNGKRGVTMDEIDALAALFGVTPESLITEQKSRSDQPRHSRDTTSPSTLGGVREDPRTTSRLRELESVNQDLTDALADVLTLADDFIASLHGKVDGPASQARSASRGKTDRRRRRRTAH